MVQIGHEIRNPLNAILGSSEQLSGETLTVESRQQAIAIHDAADLMHALATNMLGFFSGTAASMPVECVSFDLRDVLEGLNDVLSKAAWAKRLHFEIHFEPGCPANIESDPQHLRHILANVAKHAIALTDNGHVEITVHGVVSAPETNGLSLSISVADTGPSFAPATVAKIFEPFGLEGALAGGSPPGIGFNLCMARAFARHLGGEITCTPLPTAGSVYRIEIPVRMLSATTGAEVGKAAAAGSAVVALNDIYARHRAQLGAKHILVAEDQVSNQHVIRSTLQRGGHSVVVVETGDEALDYLTQGGFDAVVIDLRLPGTSGIDVMKLSKFIGKGQQRNIPFIVVTGDATEQTRQACFNAGAAAYLTKPVSAEQLLERLLAVHERPTLVGGGSIVVQTAIDLEAISNVVAPSVVSGLPSRVLLECLRDALRYTSEIEHAIAKQDWPAVQYRVRAIRGAAHILGAVRVVAMCTRIINTPQGLLEASMPVLLAELVNTLDEARKALSALFQNSPVPG
jgi:CheY-like chemotaxis protein/HPt (histidine-containing phosphotransfer) domain-containing protein